MPIKDLLAQISGDSSSHAARPASAQRPSLAPKRKADDYLHGDVSKTPRGVTPTTRPIQATSKVVDKPSSIQRPLASQMKNPAILESKSHSRSSLPPAKSVQARTPAAGASNGAPPAPKATPKKGSFAEIMARGQRAQAVMGQVGKIQHKKSQKGQVIKREESRGGSAGPDRKSTGNSQSRGYTGSARAPQRPGANGQSNGARNGGSGGHSNVSGAAKSSSGKKPSKEHVGVDQQKKIKKAAQATTGYAGTARPRPGNPAKRDSAPRGGALLVSSAPRAGKSSRYDDYDEEMDDFIDYDDEEDNGGPRYDYDSDRSSDMEAGLDELDDEEQQAERIARREDIEEERRERDRKMAKEERKRKALEALRGRKL